MRGRDIKRYECNFADLWLINTHNGLKGRNLPPIDINDYPAIKKHLDNYYPKLSKRADKGVTPYNLRNCAYMDDFLQQKIVYREISDQMNACMVSPDVYINNKCYMITGKHLIYLISVFNSTLFNKVILQSANTTGGKGFAFLENIHIPVPPADIEEKLIRLYNLRAASNPKTIDKEVDDIIYGLFGLSEKEISTIESM